MLTPETPQAARSVSKGEILIEFIMQGNVVKVTAIDAASGVEASIVGPANAPKEALSMAAARKLKYVMEKQKR
jgi:hypothetical protein